MENTPKTLWAFDDAYILKRRTEDERDWMLGQYIMQAFGVVLSKSFSKNSKAEYFKEPLLSTVFESEEQKDSEVLEMKAFAEMQKFAVIMKQQGLPETEMVDIEGD